MGIVRGQEPTEELVNKTSREFTQSVSTMMAQMQLHQRHHLQQQQQQHQQQFSQLQKQHEHLHQQQVHPNGTPTPSQVLSQPLPQQPKSLPIKSTQVQPPQHVQSKLNQQSQSLEPPAKNPPPSEGTSCNSVVSRGGAAWTLKSKSQPVPAMGATGSMGAAGNG